MGVKLKILDTDVVRKNLPWAKASDVSNSSFSYSLDEKRKAASLRTWNACPILTGEITYIREAMQWSC